MIGYLYWDPSPYISDFSLPLLNRPILWYGALFALGFLIGFYLLRYLLTTYLLSRPYFTREDLRLPQGIVTALKAKVSDKEFQSLFENPKLSVEKLSQGLNHLVSSLEKTPSMAEVSCLWSRFIRLLSIKQRSALYNRLWLDKILKPMVYGLFARGKLLSESIAFACMLGAVIGARLGDVFFYQGWNLLIQDPFLIFRIWEGGLASHGGALGVIIALILTSKKKIFQNAGLSLLSLLDLIVIPTAFLACLIRIGNFINQEILGTTTSIAWAVIFGHPADGSLAVPRHPVQLYEALVYLALFICLGSCWKKWFMLKRPGRLFGLFIALLFFSRFFLEFFKVEQSALISLSSSLTMGQYLSIPFIFIGIFFFFRRPISQ
ncbi:MAG: prolipoprotein diacylglyceryl transferase [Chlamydiae bacterium]|nr:prolipoprotein diacylglyceryl transferase [Chlamydiota bacterium]